MVGASEVAYNVAAVSGLAAGLIFVHHVWDDKREGRVKPTLLLFSLMYILQELMQIPYLIDKTFALIKIAAFTTIYIVATLIIVL